MALLLEYAVNLALADIAPNRIAGGRLSLWRIRVSILQINVLITVTQLPLHTGIAAVVLLVLFHRALVSI